MVRVGLAVCFTLCHLGSPGVTELLPGSRFRGLKASRASWDPAVYATLADHCYNLGSRAVCATACALDPDCGAYALDGAACHLARPQNVSAPLPSGDVVNTFMKTELFASQADSTVSVSSGFCSQPCGVNSSTKPRIVSCVTPAQYGGEDNCAILAGQTDVPCEPVDCPVFLEKILLQAHSSSQAVGTQTQLQISVCNEDGFCRDTDWASGFPPGSLNEYSSLSTAGKPIGDLYGTGFPNGTVSRVEVSSLKVGGGPPETYAGAWLELHFNQGGVTRCQAADSSPSFVVASNGLFDDFACSYTQV